MAQGRSAWGDRALVRAEDGVDVVGRMWEKSVLSHTTSHPEAMRPDDCRCLCPPGTSSNRSLLSIGTGSNASILATIKRYYDGLVDKMLGCGNPDQMGYIEYRCLHCGEGTHRVAMSCKSSLCLRCAKVYVDHWVSQVSQMLHEGVIYRHRVLTMPAMLRKTFYQQATSRVESVHALWGQVFG